MEKAKAGRPPENPSDDARGFRGAKTLADLGISKTQSSLAQQLYARGCTQQEIADQLGVAHTTVGRWIMHFTPSAECIDAPALPSTETLDAIAVRIRSEARTSTTRFPKWAHRPIFDVSIRWSRGRRMPRDSTPPSAVVEVVVAGGRSGRLVAACDAGSFRIEVVGSNWVSRLAAVAWLDRDQLEAAEMLAAMFDQAGMMPRVCGGYDGGRVDAAALDFGLEREDERRAAVRRKLSRLLGYIPARDRATVEATVLWDLPPASLQALQRGLSAVARALRHPSRR